MRQLGADGGQIFRPALQVEAAGFVHVTRQNVVLPFRVILEALDHQEHRTQEKRDSDVLHRPAQVAFPQRVMGEHHGQAAANEHEGIHGADPFP